MVILWVVSTFTSERNIYHGESLTCLIQGMPALQDIAFLRITNLLHC